MVSNRHSDQYSLRSLPLLIIMIIICYGLMFTFVLTFRSTETVSLDPDPDDEASLTATAQALLQNPIVFQLPLDPEDKYHIFWTLDYKSESATIEVRTQLHSQTDWFAIGFSDYGNITNADLCIFWFDLHQKSHFDVSAPQNIPSSFPPIQIFCRRNSHAVQAHNRTWKGGEGKKKGSHYFLIHDSLHESNGWISRRIFWSRITFFPLLLFSRTRGQMTRATWTLTIKMIVTFFDWNARQAIITRYDSRFNGNSILVTLRITWLK